MNKIKITAMKAVANINGTNYPMYSGFLSARELDLIAEVPNYDRKKSHHKIASSLLNKPVDEWQRPIEENKVNKIKEIYSETEKDNLMANPILLGIAKTNINIADKVEIKQKYIEADQKMIEMKNVYEISVYSKEKKPLWILDGQHRIRGMLESIQSEQPIPFVLLYDEVYTPNFLAEIFTHVTTGATPMKPLHSEWMQYSFNLDKFKRESELKSMQTTIYLCIESQFGGVPNIFQNKIQFNPYIHEEGYKAFKFNMSDWNNLISTYYYGRRGKLDSKELANQIVWSIKAAERKDRYCDNGSKLFSNENPHQILAEGFIIGLLKYILQNGGKNSSKEWEDFFTDSDRKFQKCDWRLLFVKSNDLSGSYGKNSKEIAIDAFDILFNSPEELDGSILTDYLEGENCKFAITAYKMNSNGNKSKTDSYTKEISPQSLVPFDVNNNEINRDIIYVESSTRNCRIIDVKDININPNKKLNNAIKQKGQDISNFRDRQKIAIKTMSYGGGTLKVTEIRLDK